MVAWVPLLLAGAALAKGYMDSQQYYPEGQAPDGKALLASTLVNAGLGYFGGMGGMAAGQVATDAIMGGAGGGPVNVSSTGGAGNAVLDQVGARQSSAAPIDQSFGAGGAGQGGLLSQISPPGISLGQRFGQIQQQQQPSLLAGGFMDDPRMNSILMGGGRYG
jgi:hypothetical protein